MYIHQEIRTVYKCSVAQYRADKITPLNHLLHKENVPKIRVIMLETFKVEFSIK